jgi:hypothetical protein
VTLPILVEEYLKKKLKERIDEQLDVETIDHQVEIIRTEYRVDEAGFNTHGRGRDWDQQTRTSTANCSDKDITEVLTFSVKETKTTTWSISSEVSFGSETTFSVSGTSGKADAGGAATASVSEKISVSLKVGGTHFDGRSYDHRCDYRRGLAEDQSCRSRDGARNTGAWFYPRRRLSPLLA